MGDIKFTRSDFYSGCIKSAPLDPLVGFKGVVGGGREWTNRRIGRWHNPLQPPIPGSAM